MGRGKKQIAVRVNDELYAQIQEVAVLLSKGKRAVALNYGESTIAAAVRYVLNNGIQAAKDELLVEDSDE